MNCPGHSLIYKSRLRSYRELPIRYADLGTVYRYERSGVLHGMMRVREATHAHHAVQDARALVAVHGAEVGVADRQLAVGSQPGLVDQGMARAVHRLDDLARVLPVGRVHVLPVK